MSSKLVIFSGNYTTWQEFLTTKKLNCRPHIHLCYNIENEYILYRQFAKVMTFCKRSYRANASGRASVRRTHVVNFAKNIGDSKCCISDFLKRIKTTFFLGLKGCGCILLCFSNIYNQKNSKYRSPGGRKLKFSQKCCIMASVYP